MGVSSDTRREVSVAIPWSRGTSLPRPLAVGTFEYVGEPSSLANVGLGVFTINRVAGDPPAFGYISSSSQIVSTNNATHLTAFAQTYSNSITGGTAMIRSVIIMYWRPALEPPLNIINWPIEQGVYSTGRYLVVSVFTSATAVAFGLTQVQQPLHPVDIRGWGNLRFEVAWYTESQSSISINMLRVGMVLLRGETLPNTQVTSDVNIVSATNVQPVWVSGSNPNVVPSPSDIIVRHNPNTLVQKVRVAYYVLKNGSDHAPEYHVHTVNGVCPLEFVAHKKKQAVLMLRTAVAGLYGRNLADIEMNGVEGYDAWLQAIHNVMMHTLNGNMKFSAPQRVVIDDAFNTPPILRKLTESPDMEEDAVVVHLSDRVEELARLPYDTNVLGRYEAGLYIIYFGNPNGDYPILKYCTRHLDFDEDGVSSKPEIAPTRPSKPADPNNRYIQHAELRSESIVAKDMAQQKIAVVARLTKRFKVKGDLGIWVARNSPSRDLVALLADSVFGAGWMEKKKMESEMWSVYCFLQRIKASAMFSKIWLADSSWAEMFGEEWHDSSTVLESERAAHNKEVHSLTGNTSFAKDMEEVDRNWPYTKFFTEKPDLKKPVADGRSLANKISTMETNTNPNMGNYSRTTVIRSDICDDVGAIGPNRLLMTPLTSMFPRTIRNGPGGALIASVRRLPYVGFRIIWADGAKIEVTEYAKKVRAMREALVVGSMKADAMTPQSFYSQEVANLAFAGGSRALVMDQCLARLVCLHDLLCWRANHECLPHNQFAVIDQHTMVDGGFTQFVFNDVPNEIFGEGCGGNQAVFPYNGLTGRLCFHVSELTVPPEDFDSIVYMPPELAFGDDDFRNGAEIFLFVMMWASWPYGLYRIQHATRDSGGGGLAGQHFVSLLNLIDIPGLMNIHVILPHKLANRIPTAQPEANNMCVRPFFGNAPSALYAAGVPLDICFQGGAPGLRIYNLAQYLYTWAQDVTAGLISNFIQKLGLFTGVVKSLDRVRQLIDAAAHAVPIMAEGGIGATAAFNVNSGLSFATSRPVGQRHSFTQVDFPFIPGFLPDFLLHATDTRAWNRVATGLAVTNENLLTTVYPEWLGNVYSPAWSELRAMQFAATYSVFSLILGLPADVWNVAALNTVIRGPGMIVRQLTNAHVQQTELIGADLGPTMAYLFGNLTGCGLAHTSVPNPTNIYDWICSNLQNYDTVGRAVADTIVSDWAPVLLADVWLQIITERLPKAFCAFPPSGTPFACYGYNAGLKAFDLPGQLGIYTDASALVPYYDQNATPDVSDEAIWNQRLALVFGQAIPTDSSGVAYVPNIPVNRYPKQRPVVNPFYLQGPVLEDSVLTAVTGASPRMDREGRSFVMQGPVNTMTRVRNASNRQSYIGAAAWLLHNLASQTFVRTTGTAVAGVISRIKVKLTSDASEEGTSEQ